MVIQNSPLHLICLLLWSFQFQEVNHANSILKDENKRRIYDKYGTMGLKLADQIGEEVNFSYLQL